MVQKNLERWYITNVATTWFPTTLREYGDQLHCIIQVALTRHAQDTNLVQASNLGFKSQVQKNRQKTWIRLTMTKHVLAGFNQVC